MSSRSLVTPSASHDIMTYPRPLIGHCWPLLTSDWPVEVRTDIVTDLNMTQASGRHIFCFPDSEAGRGEVHHRIFPETEISVWRVWVGDIVTLSVYCVKLSFSVNVIIKTNNRLDKADIDLK